MQDSHNKYFYQLFAERKFTNWKCLSISSPIRPITFPIVNAASTVPIPRPLICPRISPVMHAVVPRQIISKETLILEYFTSPHCAQKTRDRCRKADGRPLYVSLKFILLFIILRCRHGSYLFCPGYQAVHHRQIQQYRQLLQVYVSVLLRFLSGKGSQNCILP